MWYIIMISTEANMILVMNESSSTCDKIISCDKILISSEASSAWYIIMISAEANMMLVMNKLSLTSDKMITSSESQST